MLVVVIINIIFVFIAAAIVFVDAAAVEFSVVVVTVTLHYFSENGYIDYDEYIAFLAKFKKNTDTERLELREAFR